MTTANSMDPELGEMRRCTKCGESWPADSEFFNQVVTNKPRLRGWCKACESDRRKPEVKEEDSYE